MRCTLVSSQTSKGRIQARPIGNGLCTPVTTKLCLGVDLRKVLDGTVQFPPEYVLTITFLCVDISEFTSIRQNELSAIGKPAHIQRDRYPWQHTLKKKKSRDKF